MQPAPVVNLFDCLSDSPGLQLNSVGLSKNMLRALEASSADLPGLDAFPKSHIITFKYYVGVIHFLDENYREVSFQPSPACHLCGS